MNYNPFSIEGKTILITGASSGIGRSTAIECSKLGATLIITGRDEIRLKETFSQLTGNNHNLIFADLSDDSEIEKLVISMPELDGIVHSAGFLKKLPFKFLTMDSLLETFQSNFFGPALLTQKLHKKKKLKNECSVVFISSIAANVASVGNSSYMASKGALHSLSRGMALELSDKKIRVNCIEPALVKTNLTSSMSVEDLDKYEKRFPLGRFGKPEEIAFASIYLLSDAAKWITGTSLRIDGGITLS